MLAHLIAGGLPNSSWLQHCLWMCADNLLSFSEFCLDLPLLVLCNDSYCCLISLHCSFGFVLSAGLAHGLYPGPLGRVPWPQVIASFVAADCWAGQATYVLSALRLRTRCQREQDLTFQVSVPGPLCCLFCEGLLQWSSTVG